MKLLNHKLEEYIEMPQLYMQLSYQLTSNISSFIWNNLRTPHYTQIKLQLTNSLENQLRSELYENA